MKMLVVFICYLFVVYAQGTEILRSVDFDTKLAYDKKYAVVIGINKYEKLPISKGPHFDAAEVAGVLASRYGFNHVSS